VGRPPSPSFARHPPAVEATPISGLAASRGWQADLATPHTPHQNARQRGRDPFSSSPDRLHSMAPRQPRMAFKSVSTKRLTRRDPLRRSALFGVSLSGRRVWPAAQPAARCITTDNSAPISRSRRTRSPDSIASPSLPDPSPGARAILGLISRRIPGDSGWSHHQISCCAFHGGFVLHAFLRRVGDSAPTRRKKQGLEPESPPASS
jgi:hypothetical protein